MAEIKQWGNIWEEKIKEQNEVGIIHGTNSSARNIQKELDGDLKLFKKWLFPKIKEGSLVLDCGTGPMARHAIMFSQNGYRVTGVDISPTTINHAKKWIKKYKQDIKFAQANLIDLSKIKKQFDLVFCTQTFGHIPSYLAIDVLREFNKKTKKNGLCLIQFWHENEKDSFVLFREFLYNFLFRIKSKFVRTFPVNCSAYTKKEIRDMCNRAGFEIIDSKLALGFYLLKKS